MITVLIPDHAAPLTRRACFDAAYRWALSHAYCTRRHPSGKIGCYYRSPDHTNACLMGCLIPDSCGVELESHGGLASGLMADYPEIDTLFADEVKGEFLDALQAVHDAAARGGIADPYDAVLPALSTDQYHANLRAFAAQQGLTVPAV